MRYLLLWSMFVPLGACWSVDHWLSRRRGAASPPAGNGVGPPIVSLGVAALFVQLTSIYLCAGVHKLEHPAWRQGAAVYRALQVYTRTTPLGDWLLNFPHFLSLTSLVLPVLQILGAVYLFVPFLMGRMRTLIVFSYAAFQIHPRCLHRSRQLPASGGVHDGAVSAAVVLGSLAAEAGHRSNGGDLTGGRRLPKTRRFLGAKWRAAFLRSPLAESSQRSRASPRRWVFTCSS